MNSIPPAPAILVAVVLWCSPPASSQDADIADPFRPVDLVAELPGKAFLIEGGVDEIDVRDGIIRRITLGADGKSLSILFDIQGDNPYKPNLTIWLVDRYGLPVKRCWESWILTSIPAGSTRSHDATFQDADPAEVLQWTSVGPPSDSGTPKYLVIDYRH